MSVRRPAVAGSFYPADKAELREMIGEFAEPGRKREKALGVISPHAGYIYSGKGAAIVFSRVEIPKDVIVLGPNHRGIGADIALWPEGSWSTPLGEVEVNAELGEMIGAETSLVELDEGAHQSEHSLEVQIPFLQYFRKDFRLTALCLLRMSYAQCEELGKAISRAVKEWDQPALMVASSDMSHYLPAEKAKRQDRMALDQALQLNPEGLYAAVVRNNISMCGFIPATVMLVAARELGAESAELADYRNSGEVTGDDREVVSYAAVIIK